MARIQTCTVAVLALLTVAICGLLTGGATLPTIPRSTETWFSVVFLAVLATAAAMLLLSWAQSRLTATRAAIILTLEPAVAGVTGALLGDEFGVRTIAGGALLLGAMLLVEVGSGRRIRRRRLSQHQRPAPSVAQLPVELSTVNPRLRTSPAAAPGSSGLRDRSGSDGRRMAWPARLSRRC